MKISLQTALIGAIALVSLPSQAATVLQDFDLEFSTGPLVGQTFPGTVTYADNNLTGTGLELLVPAGSGFLPFPFVFEGLLEIDVTVDGFNHTISDDTGYPDFPFIAFIDGNFFGMDYISDAGNSLLEVVAANGDSIEYFNPNGELSTGTFQVGSSRRVPDGGMTLALTGVSLLGLAGARRFLK